MPKELNKTRRIFLLCLGFVTLSLGILGIFLPLLPTTVFLLISAWCWMRSSHRFYLWLIGNRWFGSYIRNYREKRGITVRQKVLTLLLLWLGIGYTALIIVTEIWLKILLLAVAVGVTTHILLLKTIPDDRKDKGETDNEAVDISGMRPQQREEPNGRGVSQR